MAGASRTVVALVAITRIASAQPVLDPLPLEPRPMSGDPRAAGGEPRPAGGDPKMPITVRPGGEVLGGDVVPPSPPPLSIEHAIDPETYVCGPGDVFELDFWGAQNFRLKLTTDLEGRAFIAKVGFVAAAGKTLSAVRAAVKSRVRANYPGLNFDLTLVSPRSFVVHVVDNVQRPGAYTSRALDRVSTVIARAGVVTDAKPSATADVKPGATARAAIGSRRRIAIKHHDGTTATADLVRYELTGDVAYNPFLLDGDVLAVPFASPVVTITGAVRRPGQYELISTKDLAELLELAGGFTSSVSRSLPLRLIRRNARQQEAVTELPFTGAPAPNTPLEDDDQIIVRGSDELQRTVLVIGAVTGADPLDAATTSRRMAYVDGDTVLSLLDRVGGIRAPGDLRRSYISRPRPGQAPELIPLDLEALIVRRDFTADRPIVMNDTIVVPPMQYSVLVEGAVVRAGLYNYNPTFGVPEYIAHAGGRTRTARDLDDVQLIDRNGHTHPFQAQMKPEPGDAILVPERNFTRSEVAQLILAGASIVLSGIAVTIAATK